MPVTKNLLAAAVKLLNRLNADIKRLNVLLFQSLLTENAVV